MSHTFHSSEVYLFNFVGLLLIKLMKKGTAVPQWNGNLAWKPLSGSNSLLPILRTFLGNLALGTLPGRLFLETCSSEPLLGNLLRSCSLNPLGTCSWESCWEPIFRNLAWEPVLENLGWGPVLGNLFLNPCLGTCSWEPLAWEPVRGNFGNADLSCSETFTVAEVPKLQLSKENI